MYINIYMKITDKREITAKKIDTEPKDFKLTSS